MRFTALEPGQRSAWESWDGRMLKVQWAFDLGSQIGRTHLVQWARVMPTILMGRIILAAMRKRQMPKENAQSLANIRLNLEEQ